MAGIFKFSMMYLEHVGSPPLVVQDKAMGVTVTEDKHCAGCLLTSVPSRIALPFCNRD